jgi:hypothetical protein
MDTVNTLLNKPFINRGISAGDGKHVTLPREIVERVIYYIFLDIRERSFKISELRVDGLFMT